VVLGGFIYSDKTGIKYRPAVIISTDLYHRGRKEVIVSAITSKINRLLIGDYLIADWKEAALLYPSVATGILRTIKQSVIHRRLGVMSPKDIEIALRKSLGL